MASTQAYQVPRGERCALRRVSCHSANALTPCHRCSVPSPLSWQSSSSAEILPLRSCSPRSSSAWVSFHTCSAHCRLACCDLLLTGYLRRDLLLTGYLRRACPRAKPG